MSTDVMTEAERADAERALKWLRVAAVDGGSVTLSPQEALALAKRLRLAEAAAAPKPAPVFATQTAPAPDPRSSWEPLSETDRQNLRVGDVVAVTTDDGTDRVFDVRLVPWKLYHDQWLVGLTGVPGGYDLDRVRARRK